MILSEISQNQKDKDCMARSTYIDTQNSQIHRDRKQNHGYQGLREGENVGLFNGCKVSVWDDKKILEMVVIGIQHCEYS